MKYKDEVVLRYPLKKRIKRCLGLRVGKLIDRLKFYLPVESLGRRFDDAHKYYLTKKGYDDDYYNKYASNNRLTDEQIENIIQYQEQVYSKPRHEYFEKTPIKDTIQGLVVPLIKLVIHKDPQVCSVLDIGARYAFVDYIMACEFPNIHFICADFAPDLAELNSRLNRENISFHSGYALELLETGEISADIAYFSSTATLINNLELRNYFRTLSTRVNYVIINEPILAPMDGTVINPGYLPLDTSVPVWAKCLTHNYRGMVKEAGYEVLHYHVFPYERTRKEPDLHMLHLIARNSKKIER